MPFVKGQSGNPGGRGKEGKLWADAIKRAISRRKAGLSNGLDSLADKLVDLAENGESWALKEIGDRLDGKPAQSMSVDVREITHEEALEMLDD